MSLWNQKIKPMLAFSSEPFDSENFIFEIKFDGTRCVAYVDVENKSQKFLNRRMLYFQNRYPELQLWKDLKCRRAIVDGEIVVFEKGKPNFYKLAEREHIEEKTKIEILSQMMPATFVVFDILHKDEKDLIDLPLEERKRILDETIEESERILKSVYIKEKGRKFFNEVKKKKLEGVMAKKLNSSYQIGKRSRDWLKIKALKTLDVVIVGYSTGKGKRGELLGSLITAINYKNKLRYIGKVGTGFSEEELKVLLEKLKKIKTEKPPWKEEIDLALPPDRKPIWVKPKFVCEVKFMQLTKDLQMRAPSFIRLREDKTPGDCDLEVEFKSK
ncbi:MAG: non-homologous end-joining DNA ligase [Candidatus Aenigmatarchaeota archaeon]